MLSQGSALRSCSPVPKPRFLSQARHAAWLHFPILDLGPSTPWSPHPSGLGSLSLPPAGPLPRLALWAVRLDGAGTPRVLQT